MSQTVPEAEPTHASGVTVTFTPFFRGKFLFVQRAASDPIFGGYWCFPGGRVHAGETLVSALIRELHEETALTSTGRAFFVDTYLLGDRVGVHFGVEVTSARFQLSELDNGIWLEHPSQLKAYQPLIPGIENHLSYSVARLAQAGELAWQSLDEFHLVKHRFLNS